MTELFNLMAEQSVIGGLLVDPRAHERIDSLQDGDFYHDHHRIIYRHIGLMLAIRQPVDVLTVTEALAAAGEEERVGGLAYLGELAANTPSASNIERYAEIVIEKRMLRDLMAVSDRIAELARAPSGVSVPERIDEAQGLMLALTADQAAREGEPQPIAAYLGQFVEEVQTLHDSDGDLSGVATGYADLDEKTCGLQPGDLIVVAGRPSMGKTAIALNIAEHVAVNLGLPVAVFSMEMGSVQLSRRAVASIGRIDMTALRTGQLTDEQWSRMSFAIGKLHEAPLEIDETGGLTLAQVSARARRVKKRHGGKLGLLVIDYIQLMSGGPQFKGANREQEIASISRGLKALAKELAVPVIALSQLSRKVEERTEKRPMMSDLRESGAIEQDADVILLMYRDEYYHPNSPGKGIAEVIIGKQRNGETGTVYLAFEGAYSRFSSLSHDDITRLHQSRRDAKPSRSNRRGFDD